MVLALTQFILADPALLTAKPTPTQKKCLHARSTALTLPGKGRCTRCLDCAFTRLEPSPA